MLLLFINETLFINGDLLSAKKFKNR